MYEVNGFVFESEEIAAKAQKEADGIKYIKSQTRMDNPDVVLDLYNKIIQKKMFDTPVGIAFLMELQEYLKTVPYIMNEDIRPIPVRNGVVIKSAKNDNKSEKKPANKHKSAGQEKTSGGSRFFVFTTVVLALIVVGMFVISYMSQNNTNIINYENEIIDKYEIWETKLKEKENQLNAREKALEEKEGNINNGDNNTQSEEIEDGED